jgi:hypothetical protein
MIQASMVKNPPMEGHFPTNMHRGAPTSFVFDTTFKLIPRKSLEGIMSFSTKKSMIRCSK